MEQDPEALGDILGKIDKPQGKPSKPVSTSPFVEEPECKVCGDRGWVISVDPAFMDKAYPYRCECQHESDELARKERLFKNCHLPSSAIDCRFETFDVRPGIEEAFAKAKLLAEGSGELQWLTLMGLCDVGKSHLAMAVAQAWLAMGRKVRYAAVPELLDDLRNAYNPDSEISYETEFEIIKAADLLVLDDLGMESPTPWAQEKLDLIVELRSRENKALMVTTNQPLTKISQRIASRLQRFVPGAIIPIVAEEYVQYRSS